MRKASRNDDNLHATDKIKTARFTNQRVPLPQADILKKWLCSKFQGSANHPILVLNGVGERWKAPKSNSVILTACQLDIPTLQIKTFHRILLLRELTSEFLVTPWVYILTLRERIAAHAKGLGSGFVEDRISEVRRFLRELFLERGVLVEMKEDETDVGCVLPTTKEFDESLEDILEEMRTPEELMKSASFGKKKTVLTAEEKEFLKIYLFDRRMFEILTSKEHRTESANRYSFISWGLEAQMELGVSYNIFDESNIGSTILRRLVCIENDLEYPGTIVLPDPLKISGKPMRYQVQQRDLNPNETLILADSYSDIHRKLVIQNDVSNEFLNYLVRDLIMRFGSTALRKKTEVLPDSRTNLSFERRRELVARYYWSFIKPYHDIVMRITGLREGLQVPEEFCELSLRALASKRNRSILHEITCFGVEKRRDITISELANRMGFDNKLKRSLYRNLRQLEACSLVQSYPEGLGFRRYRITGKARKIIIKWELGPFDD